MKKNKLIKLHLKFFNKYVHYKKDLWFISNLCAFMCLLKMNYEKQDENIFFKNYNLELIDPEKIINIINSDNDLTIDLIEHFFQFYNIKKDYEIFWSIIKEFCKIYDLLTKTKKINYFFDKKYNDQDNENSIKNYMIITQLIGEFNNNVKILINKNYADVIKFAKNIFLKVDLYE